MEREREKEQLTARMQELRDTGLSLGMFPGSPGNRMEGNRFADAVFTLGSRMMKVRSGDEKQFGGVGSMPLSETSLRMVSDGHPGCEERRPVANSGMYHDSRVDAVRSLTPVGLLQDSTSSSRQSSVATPPPLYREGISQRGSPQSGSIIHGSNMAEGQRSFATDPHSMHLAMELSKRSVGTLETSLDHQQQLPKGGQRRRTTNTKESKMMVAAGNAQQALHQHALQQQQHGIQNILYHHPNRHPHESFFTHGQYKGMSKNPHIQGMQQFGSSQHLEMSQPRSTYMTNHPLKVEPVELEPTASADRMQLRKASPMERSSPSDALSPKESVSVAETRGEAVGVKRMLMEESKPSASLGSAAESKDSVRSGLRPHVGDRESLHSQSQSSGRTSRENIFADLNAEPPASDGGDECLLQVEETQAVVQPESSRTTTEENSKRKRKKPIKDLKLVDMEEVDNKRIVKPAKSHAKPKMEFMMNTFEGDGDSNIPPVGITKEDKLRNLRTDLIHVTKKQPKNANAYFILGLFYQRSRQFPKAVAAYKQAAEALKQSEIDCNQSRAELMATIQAHHEQCLFEELFMGSDEPDGDLVDEALKRDVSKLRGAAPMRMGQAAVWSTLGLNLLRSGKIENAVYLMTSLLDVVPDQLDALNNLGVAYLHSGDLERSARCFQTLLEKDKLRPGACANYAVQLLQQYGFCLTSAGAGAGPIAFLSRLAAARAAKQCLEVSLKEDPKAGHIWANLAAAHTTLGNIGSASQALEQAARLDPARMSIRYAVAAHRIKVAERCEDGIEQLGYAANEMASMLREGDVSTAHPSLGWAGLGMVNRAQYESAVAFQEGNVNLKEAEDRAQHTLERAVDEDPRDAVQWHQLGVHTMFKLQFGVAQKFLKTSIARRRSCIPAWSNLGVAVQLSEDPSISEGVYKQALRLAPQEQAHSIHSNLGNLYRQQKRFREAHQCFEKALDLCPDYAPACNNLGLLLVAQNKWREAVSAFDRALRSDPCLDAAKSNRMKAVVLGRLNGALLEEADYPSSNPAVANPATNIVTESDFTAVVSSAEVPSLAVHSPPQQAHRDPFPLPSVS
ncbi:hypothetical protein R1sor_027288 [Riccia sorocarpa]|uniref:Tetratricopeptide repeat protein n=1 Tax=Riccia sorocarpa TaxID=122646 RepID=A0ABD3GDT1_9MARC